MTQTNIEQDRIGFELAASNEFEQPSCLERDGDGYSDGYADSAWWGWQAALKLQRDRHASEHLEQMLKMLPLLNDKK